MSIGHAWGVVTAVASCLLIGPLATADEVRLPDPPRVPAQALRTIRHLAIQHNGRHKPFDSFARETLSLITGEPRIAGQDPVTTILGLLAEPDRWQTVPLIHVPFVPLREPLGMARRTTHISYNDLVASRKLMRMLPPIVEKQRRDEKLTILENETMDAFQRFVAFSRLAEHELELVPRPSASWQSIQQHETWRPFVDALRRGDSQAIESSAARLADTLRAISPAAYPAPWRLRLEVFYNRAMPFRIAWVAYLAAAIALGVALAGRSRAAPIGIGLLVLAFIVHAAGIITRVVLGGRPPVSNFFETMLWLPFVGVALALVFERIYRARLFGMAAAILAAITLALSEQVPLDSSIAPVVAVLRSNLWLTIHVLTIVASYGALALATVLAHLYGGLYLAGRKGRKTLEALDLFLYRAIQVGVVLLAGGVMLGAVWANASWGRYWGWDPKETWALITLLWFLAILHGRFAGWLSGIGVVLATIGGFLLLLMTYYGVSFYLVGLHSYAGGHAKPLPALLVAYLIAEAAFLAVVGIAALTPRPRGARQ